MLLSPAVVIGALRVKFPDIHLSIFVQLGPSCWEWRGCRWSRGEPVETRSRCSDGGYEGSPQQYTDGTTPSGGGSGRWRGRGGGPRRMGLTLTLKAPIATKVVCFSRLLKCLRSLFGKQCGPRSDCSYRSSLFWVHAVCFYT